MTGLSDNFQRPIDYLRISVTDRCNMRCIYCMPAAGIIKMPHLDILSYEEIYRVATVAVGLGIDKIRITGGEPLVRLGLSGLIRMLAQIETVKDISLTTNGVLLSRYAGELKAAGLRRVNVSLDTLRSERFRAITRSDINIDDVLTGIEVAGQVGLKPVKINMVVMAGINDDEVLDFARKTIEEGWHVRFIELMPVVGEDNVSSQFIPAAEVKKRIKTLGELETASPGVGNGPAVYYRFPGASGTIGFITPVSEHFCVACNRLRLTADGKLRPCLLLEDEVDIRHILRENMSAEEIEKQIRKAVLMKPLHHKLAEGNMPNHRPFSQVGG